ncbi:MAG: hypothetical protein GXP25_08685 [Planctomycetes bacterium]|nr:hypothetical protein [Planctomycetota bacterium]
METRAGISGQGKRIVLVAVLGLLAGTIAADDYRTPIGQCAPFTYDGWEPIGPGEAGGLQSVRPHPKNRDIVIAGSDALGIQLSRDGGQTWNDVTGGLKDLMTQYICLGINPADPDVLYVGCTGGFWRKRME